MLPNLQTWGSASRQHSRPSRGLRRLLLIQTVQFLGEKKKVLVGARGNCCARLPNAMLTLNAAIIWGALLGRDPHTSLPWKAGRKSVVQPHHACGCLCVALVCGAGGPGLSWGSTRLWFLQPGCQSLCPLRAKFSDGSRNHAKVIYNELSNSKGNSSIWGLAQWAESAGQLPGTGTGTCSLAVPQC